MAQNPMDEMEQSSEQYIRSILANIRTANEAYIQETQDSVARSLQMQQTALNQMTANSRREIERYRAEQKSADEAEKQRIQEKIDLINQQIAAEEEKFNRAAIFSAKEIDFAKQKQQSQEKLNQLQAQSERERRQQFSGQHMATEAMSKGINALTKGPQKEISASQILTPKLDAFIEGQEKQLNILYDQLEVAEEGQRQEIEKQIKENQRELERAKREKAIYDGINNLNSNFVQQVNKAVQVLEDNELKANTRLMGTSKIFTSTWSTLAGLTDIMSQINRNLAISPFVKQQDVIKNISNGIANGIVTNVELRGYLESIKDGIVSTFNAFDERINKLIRVQQQDSTAARMGMEASLMKLYNQMFETSEYLQSGFDSVTDAIYEASSIIGATQAEEMEFVLQKWLGSLYSVGMSGSTVSSLASAIGQLASGDISGVGSGAQNLIAMALTRTNLTYDKLLTGGVSADELNTLMGAIVGYLQDIAKSSQGNNVVQKELSKVFGVTMPDIKAATNLTANDMKTLLGYTQSYADAQQELSNQVTSMAGRVSKSVLASNIYENFMFTAGMNVAKNPVTYFMQKILSVLPEMKIPMATVVGSGISSEIPLRDILQTALSGFGVLSAGLSAISGIGSVGGLNLNAWNPKERVARGNARIGISSGFTQTTSGSEYISAGGEDMKASAMGSAAEQSKSGGEVMGTGEADIEYTASNIYKLLTGEDSTSMVPLVVKEEILNGSEGWEKKTNAILEALRLINANIDSIKTNTGLLNGLNALFGGGNNGTVAPNSKVEIDGINDQVIVTLALSIARALMNDNNEVPVVVTNEFGGSVEGFGDNSFGGGGLRQGAIGGSLLTSYATER